MAICRLYFKTLIVVCGLILLTSISGKGQGLLYEGYAAEEHGGSEQNWGMSQDSLGNVYVANSDGVLAFNGITWELTKLPTQEFVSAIATAPDGRIYVGSLKGMGYIQRDRYGKFKHHSLLPLLNDTDRAALKEIVGIKVIDGKVFLNDLEHVYILENNRLKVLHAPNSGAPQLKNRYCIIKKDGIYEYRASRFTKSRLLSGFSSTNIKFVSDYIENQIIVLTIQGELLTATMNVVDSTVSSKPFAVDLDKKVDLSRIANVFGLRDGRVALLSDDRLTVLDKHGDIQNTLTKEATGYPFETSFAFEDSFGNYWCANSESLLNVKLNSPLTVFDRDNGLKGSVWTLAKHKGCVYFGTSKGACYRDSEKSLRSIRGSDEETLQFLEFEKELYVAHPTGIMKINRGRATKVLDHEWPTSLSVIPNSKGYLLMAAYESGLWLVKATNNRWTKFKLEGLDGQFYFSVTDGHGNIWLGEYGHRLWRIRIDIEKMVITDKQLCDTSAGLPTNLNNRAQRTSNGAVVFSTEAGIYRYDEIRKRFEPNANYKGDIASRPIFSLDEGEDGTLYFFTTDPADTSKTIAAVAKKGTNGKYTTVYWPFRVFSWIDPHAPVRVISKEEVLFGNNVRVIDYNPLQKPILPQPQVHITGVTANDSASISNISSDSRLNFSYSKNDLRISFIAPFFESAEKVMYQYKIDGLTDNWTDWTDTRDATISNLQEGDYNFIVIAKNIYGAVSDPYAIPIHIDPPFYRTSPAYLFYILSLAGVVYGLVKLNTLRIERQKKKLQREVARMTHELASINEEIMAQNEEMVEINEEINKKNTAISAQAEELLQSNFTKDKIFSIVSHDLRGPINQLHEILNLAAAGHLSHDELETFLPVLHEKSREVSVLIDNILFWAKGQMTGKKATPANLILAPAIRETLSLFRAQVKKKEIEIQINVSEELQVFADKDIVKLIVRNFVANAVKFTHEKGTIVVSATSDGQCTKISVADNGVGISQEDVAKLLSNESFSKSGTRGEHGTGIGLMMCKEFIANSEWTFSIQSTVSKGSIFSFVIPAKDTSFPNKDLKNL